MSNTDVFVSSAGIVTEAIWDDEGVTINTRQRVDPIIDTFRKLSDIGPNRKAAGRIAASVPLDVHMKWVREWENTFKRAGTLDLKAFLAMKINSSEGAPFRNQRIRG